MRSTSNLRPLAAALALALAGGAAAAEPRSAAIAPREPADGERVMGDWGLTLFTPRTIDFGSFGAPTSVQSVRIYSIGLRHWMSSPLGPFKSWGVDAGFGLALGSAKITGPSNGSIVTLDEPSVSGFSLHAGVPLALSHGRHFSFVVIPEADLIFVGATALDPASTPQYAKVELASWQLEAGVRAGAEIFFGFIGIPELSLEATLGVSLSYEYATSKEKSTGIEWADSSWAFSTARQTDPWRVFGARLAAIYYF
jgi:hypothetical protein